MKKLTTHLINIALILSFIFGAYYVYQLSHKKKPEDLYRLQPVTMGDIEQNVTANGTINPVTLVNVGTQVSGRVKKIYADYNDQVKKGQVLLELEDELFKAQIAQSLGNVKNNEASLELAKANEIRMRSLFEKEYVSKQELDQSVQALKSAEAQLSTTKAQLKRDQTNYSYSIIRSPVAGVVVDRVVDVGQTVAASLQTCQLVPIYDRAREQEQPLSPAQAFKLLENIVEQKYEADFGPFRTSTPQSFPDFALSLLTKAFQHAALAQQTLGQGLLALLQTDQPYAHLLCRLLHIGTREPYPVELGLVVERANAEFGKVEKRLGEGQRGGSAYLVHVVTSLYEIFGQDEASGAAVLRRLKPDTVSLPEFVSFNVCYCLAKTGLSAETVFASLDTPRSGDIPINELVQGLRNSLPIWLAEKDLKAAFTTIAQGRSSINQAGFSAFFDFKRYLQLAFTEPFTVSKCSFLIAIGDVYFLRERQIASELLHSLPTPTDLTQASFSQVIRKLDSEVDSERVALMWELADRYGQGQVTRRSALRALLACKVGPYASFAYYDARLDPSVLQVKERISAFSPELAEDLQR